MSERTPDLRYSFIANGNNEVASQLGFVTTKAPAPVVEVTKSPKKADKRKRVAVPESPSSE